MSSIWDDVPSGLKQTQKGDENMRESRIVPVGDLFVSEACVNEEISELRKWSSHFAFPFLKKPRRRFE